MVNQKAISARIDNYILWQIEQETMTGSMNRNKILNQGAKLWISLADARRAYRMHQDAETKKKIVNGFLKSWFPEAADWE